jgi:pimeloyl-ACP methyl ester carboxylesterase
MGHVTLTPNDDLFWNWSWDEMAKYDLPATIKLVLQQTGLRTISYVGHSQGTATGWAAFSRDYEGIAARINLFVSLAPVVYLKSSPSILLNALAKLHLDALLNLLGSKSFLPSSTFIDKIIPGFCSLFPKSCQLAICVLAGCEQGNVDAPTTAYVTNHFPAPTATKNMAKWAQSIRSGLFQMFDFGKAQNQRVYGSPTPPLYSPTNITCVDGSGACNVALFACGQDKLGDPADVNNLMGMLQGARNINIRDFFSFSAWGHTDIVWGSNAATSFYSPRLIPLLKKAASGNW